MIHFNPTPENLKLLVLWLVVVFTAIGTIIGVSMEFKKNKRDKKKKEPVAPVISKERTKCPFYGFASVGIHYDGYQQNNCLIRLVWSFVRDGDGKVNIPTLGRIDHYYS